MTAGDRLDRLGESIASFGVKLDLFVANIAKLEEIVNGTAKSGGLKERMAVVEDDVRRNKDSFKKIDENITTLRNEMLVEIGKLKKKPGVNWESVLQAVVTAIAVGVTGIVFWRVVIWLAAQAPIR